jgi:hypothetical protein
LICGRPLSQEEMFPPGRAPRYMCTPCYETAAYDSPKELCLLWGKPLPYENVRNWQKNPRELEYAFCQNQCDEYWTVLAGRVLGCQLNFNNRLPEPPSGNLIKLPCSPVPEPAKILPRYIEEARIPPRGLYMEYRFKMVAAQ